MKRSSPRACRAWLAARAAACAVGGEAGCQVLQRPPGRFGGGEQARGVGEPLTGGGEYAEQLDAVAGGHLVAATVPLHGGFADQVLGVGEPALVPGDDALGVAERGRGDRLAPPAECGACLADRGGRRSFVTGDGGHARQVSQVGRNEHDAPDPAPAVSGPAQRAGGGRGVAPGGGNTGLACRAEEFHEPDGAASSRGPAQPELRFCRFELSQGGEQPRPPVAHDRLGEAVRMRRSQVRGLVEGGQGGGLDACPGDRGDRGDHQREGEPFPARRRPGKPGREQAMPLLLGQVARQPGRVGQQDLGPRRERRIGLAG